jgi:hypothetical protein
MLALIMLTMAPSPGLGPYDRPVICVLCGPEGSADAILNVLLFVPLGLLLGHTRRAPLRAAALGFLISLAVESTQLFIPGRQPALGDLIWNTSGAVVGVFLYRAVIDRLYRTTRSPAQGLGAPLLTGLAVIAAGWLLGPRPSTHLYWSLWTPPLVGMPQYDGAVIAVTLDGVPIPPQEFPKHLNPARAWLADWTFETSLVKGEPPERLAPVIILADVGSEEAAFLGVVREDLVWRDRLWAETFGFHQPNFRVPGALRGIAVRDTVRIEVRRVGVDRCIAVDTQARCHRGFTPGRTWSLLRGAGRLSDHERRGLDLTWLLVLGLPTGFLSMGLWATIRHGVLLVGLVAASAWITPLGAWYLASDSLVILVGVGLGAWASVGIQRVLSLPY